MDNISVVWHEKVLSLEKRSRYGMATLLNETFDNAREYNFIHCSGMEEMPSGTEEAIVVIHGEHEYMKLDRILLDLDKFKRCVVILYCDEAPVFPGSRLRAPNRKIWVQTPSIGHHSWADRFMICGYPDDTKMHLTHSDVHSVERPLGWFFAGQVTHGRRFSCVAQLRKMGGGLLHETAGFWQGLPRAEYYQNMAKAKIIPCPSGPATPDSMRVAEALEAGCVPLVDANCSRLQYPNGYWDMVLKQKPPFPVVENWADLPRIMDEELAKWPQNRDALLIWWCNYKQSMVQWLREDIESLRRNFA